MPAHSFEARIVKSVLNFLAQAIQGEVAALSQPFTIRSSVLGRQLAVSGGTLGTGEKDTPASPGTLPSTKVFGFSSHNTHLVP